MLLYAVIFFLVEFIAAQQSPCPDVLTYEQESPEEDRWYGRVSLTTDSELSGIWLRIELDRPAELLGNWFGESTTEDNRRYVIKNRNYQLQPNRDPLTIRFFVKYNTASTPPRVAVIKLNGRTLCVAGAPTTTTTPEPQLFISHLRTTEPSNNQQATSHEQSFAPATTTEGNSDDNFFSGDFSPFRRPILTASIIKGSCGTVKVPARPLITYGQDTNEGEWPWHVALYRSKGLDLQYICGGSLISPKHILTAAHCVTKPKSGLPANPDLFTVYLGKHNLYRASTNVQDKSVEKIVAHPEFNTTYFNHDIAVLHLDTDVQITDFVRPVCLWEDDVSLNSVTSKLGTVVGWGFDQTGKITENLMQAKMPVVPTETCIFSNRDFFSRFTSSTTYCAGFRNDTSACSGDSGGGMVFPKRSSRGHNIVWQLRGVISLSAALQNSVVVCDTSNYIVFTDVAKHLDWVRYAMKS